MNNLKKSWLNEVEDFLDRYYEFRRKDKYKGLFGRIRAFFDKIEVEARENRKTGESYFDPAPSLVVYGSDPWPIPPKSEEEIERDTLRVILERSFSVALMKLIEDKGKDSVEVYKRANIDRKLFSKIRSQTYYIPSKRTVIALALGLELSLDETNALLKRAGFALSRSILFDVIIEYFITQGKYDIFEINEVLLAYKQQPLN